jgi:hypothetical protein
VKLTVKISSFIISFLSSIPCQFSTPHEFIFYFSLLTLCDFYHEDGRPTHFLEFNNLENKIIEGDRDNVFSCKESEFEKISLPKMLMYLSHYLEKYKTQVL